MRISDWSSDVCSSDLDPAGYLVAQQAAVAAGEVAGLDPVGLVDQAQQQVAVGRADHLVLAGPRQQLQQFLGGRGLLLLRAGVGEDLGTVEQGAGNPFGRHRGGARSEEHTSALQSLMRISY